MAISRSKYKTIYLQGCPVGSDVSSGQLDKQLGIFRNHLFLKLAAFGGKLVQVRLGIVEIDILFLKEFIHAACFHKFDLALSDSCQNLFRFLGYIDSEFSGFFFHKTLEVPPGRINGNRHIPFLTGNRFNQGTYPLTRTIFFSCTVIIIFGK